MLSFVRRGFQPPATHLLFNLLTYRCQQRVVTLLKQQKPFYVNDHPLAEGAGAGSPDDP